MSRKRKLENRDIDLQLAEIYEHLANEREAVRLKAAESLRSRLAAEVQIREIVLKRLIRGLASGRKSARVGFSVALTEFCRLYVGTHDSTHPQQFTVDEIISNLESSTRIGNDAQGHEIRDHWFGRLFGAAAIIQSQVLFNGDVKSWSRVVDLILDISLKKAWLREQCGWVLYQTIAGFKNLPSGQDYVECLLDRMHESRQMNTPEGVAIWVAVRINFPKIHTEEGTFIDQQQESSSRAWRISKILAQSLSSAEERDLMKSNGTWIPQPHFAWDIVFGALLEEKLLQIKFLDLWQYGVNDCLFNRSSSPERKYWGLQLFRRWVMSAPSSDLPSLFGDNFIRCLKDQLTSGEKLLNAMALDVVDALTARTIEDKACIPQLVSGFLDSDVTIDRQSRAKLVEKLIGHADITGLDKIVRYVVDRIDDHLKKDNVTGLSELTALAEVLISVLRTHNFPSIDDASNEDGQYRTVVHRILDCIIRHAFSMTSQPNSAQDMFKQRLMSGLNVVTAKDPIISYFPRHAVILIRELSSKRLDADSEVMEAIHQGNKLLATLEKKAPQRNDPSHNILEAFSLLLSFALLQAYSGEAGSVNTIDDLRNCYQTLIKRKTGDTEEESAVALVEIIVEFISKPSALYRRLAPKILTPFASRMNEEALKVMCRVLLTREDAAGQAELFGVENEDEAALNDAESSPDSDIEMVDASGTTSPAESTSSSGSSSNSPASSKAPSSPSAELQAFDAALASALGTSRRAIDAIHDGTQPAINGASSDTSSNADMSDAAMEALDTQLGAIFRQRLHEAKAPTPKQQRRTTRDTMVNFKTKILELLEAYGKAQPRNPAALAIASSLIRAIPVTGNRKIAERECELARALTRGFKLKSAADSTEPVDRTEDWKAKSFVLLCTAHEVVHDSSSQLQAKACSSASLLATKVYLAYGGPLDNIRQRYEQSGTTLEVKGEHKFRSGFLEDWRNWLVQAEKEGMLVGR